MSTIETPDRRQALVDGLRELAAFVEGRPNLPLSPWLGVDLDYFVRADDDTAGIATVEAIAAQLGVEVTSTGDGKPVTEDTTHFEAARRFGPIAYRALYIRRQARADHEALMSYRDAIRGDAQH